MVACTDNECTSITSSATPQHIEIKVVGASPADSNKVNDSPSYTHAIDPSPAYFRRT